MGFVRDLPLQPAGRQSLLTQFQHQGDRIHNNNKNTKNIIIIVVVIIIIIIIMFSGLKGFRAEGFSVV